MKGYRAPFSRSINKFLIQNDEAMIAITEIKSSHQLFVHTAHQTTKINEPFYCLKAAYQPTMLFITHLSG